MKYLPLSEVELQCKGCSLGPIPTCIWPNMPLSHFSKNDYFDHSSLTSGDIPKTMKVAGIAPLLMKPSSDNEHLWNYRSFGNLSFLSKFLENVVAFKLHFYMDIHELHDPTQFVYRTGQSTETAFTRIQDDLQSSMDKRTLYSDLSMMFDIVILTVLYALIIEYCWYCS